MDLTTLKSRLFEAFGGFADKRIKNLAKADYFLCYDHDAAPKDAQGKLFLWFCTVGLRAVEGDLVHIHMGSAMPRNAKVDAWWDANTATGQYGAKVLPITPETIGKLGELANLIAAITKNPYSVKAYKHVCPEVAEVLRMTEQRLKTIWMAA